MTMSDKQKNTFWNRRNIIIVAVGSLIAIGGIIVMAFWVSQQNVADDPSPVIDAEKAAAEVRQAEADGKLRSDAASQIKDNKGSAAAQLYQQAVDAEQTATRKSQLYLDLSGVYYAAKQYQEAFDAAAKAEAVNPDKFLAADWLSRLYEDQKNYTKAAEYYRLAGEWAQSEQNITALEKGYYDGKAAEMEKLAKEAGQ